MMRQFGGNFFTSDTALSRDGPAAMQTAASPPKCPLKFFIGVPEKRLGITKLFKKIPGFRPPFPWTRNDITINKIVSVEYRLLRNQKVILDWTEAMPEDGAFDYAEEQFTFSIKSSSAAKCTIEVRAKNSVNLYSDIAKIRNN